MDVRIGYSGGLLTGCHSPLTELHTTYYRELWELGPQFEVETAEGIAEFVGRYDPDDDGLWTVVDENQTVRGGIIIDSRNAGEEGLQLRYFILDPALHGNGLGRRLLERAMEFCHESGHERVFLWTVVSTSPSITGSEVSIQICTVQSDRQFISESRRQ
ncbi:GNAT family N-acetyltransferase [Haloarcula sebkhae]|uniref:GNAT family N-acetyltransferase n=1 Tax=Haloarcula sebkhae TaxID=932660 RepID=A0ACC6VRY3_9EURY